MRALEGFVVALFVALGAMLLFLVGACTYSVGNRMINGPIETGVIVGRHHQPAWVQLIQSGKVMVPIHHPETWSVTVEGRRTKTNKLDRASFNVTEEFYESARAGDPWPPSQQPRAVAARQPPP